MFAFDTGAQPARLFPGVGTDDWIDDDGLVVCYRDPTLARRHARQAEDRIAACQTIEALREEWRRSSLLADGLLLGGFGRESVDLAELYAARLKALAPNAPDDGDMGSAPDSGSEAKCKKGLPMFNLDTGVADGGGSKGPWISFMPKGSAEHGIPAGSFKIRGKDASDQKFVKPFTGISNGVVLDLYTDGKALLGGLKLGHQKEGDNGLPVRVWWPTPLHKQPRPDESRTANGGFVWRNAFMVPVALAKSDAQAFGTQTATWEDVGWGPYLGFDALLSVINTQFAANIGKCPVVRFTDAEKQGSGTNSTRVPRYEVVQWVQRPAAFAEDVPQVDAAADTPPAPKAEPAPAPAPAGDFGEEW